MKQIKEAGYKKQAEVEAAKRDAEREKEKEKEKERRKAAQKQNSKAPPVVRKEKVDVADRGLKVEKADKGEKTARADKGSKADRGERTDRTVPSNLKSPNLSGKKPRGEDRSTTPSRLGDSGMYERLIAKQKAADQRLEELRRQKELKEAREATFCPEVGRKRLARSSDLADDLFYPDVHSRLFYKEREHRKKVENELDKQFREVHPFRPSINRSPRALEDSQGSVRTRLINRQLTRWQEPAVRAPIRQTAAKHLRPQNDAPPFPAPDHQPPSEPPAKRCDPPGLGSSRRKEAFGHFHVS